MSPDPTTPAADPSAPAQATPTPDEPLAGQQPVAAQSAAVTAPAEPAAAAQPSEPAATPQPDPPATINVGDRLNGGDTVLPTGQGENEKVQVATPAAAPPADVVVPAAAEITQQPEATDPPPEQLREGRFRSLAAMIDTVTVGQAGLLARAENSPRPTTEHVVKAHAPVGLAFPSFAQLTHLLDEISKVPLPSLEDLRAWATLATTVYSLVRQFFAHAQPADQQLNATLQSLGNSVQTPAIIGSLVMRAVKSGEPTFNDDVLGRLIDGSQSSELLAMGVTPTRIVPLLNVMLRTYRSLNAAHANLPKGAKGTATEKGNPAQPAGEKA